MSMSQDHNGMSHEQRLKLGRVWARKHQANPLFQLARWDSKQGLRLRALLRLILASSVAASLLLTPEALQGLVLLLWLFLAAIFLVASSK